MRAIDALSSFLGRAAAWLGLLMIGVAVVAALGAKVGEALGRPMQSVALDELQWYLFSVLFLLAGPWALREDAHVRVDVLYGRLSARGKAWIDLVGGVVLLIPFALFAIAVTWPTAMESFRVREVSPDAGGLLRWPLELFVPFAFGLLLLQSVAEVARAGSVALGRPPADDREDRRRTAEGAPPR